MKKTYRLKHSVDWLLALVALFFLWPLFIIIPLLIHLEDFLRGEGFMNAYYEEIRVSAGEKIVIFKFRIMRPSFLRKIKEEEGGSIYLVKGYEHEKTAVSFVGKFLRNFYLDELPQLFCILGGKMSFVGPRPIPLKDVERLEKFGRTNMRAGFTGIHQINKGAKRKHADMDQEYFENYQKRGPLSLLFYDFSIMFRTIFKMGKGEGL